MGPRANICDSGLKARSELPIGSCRRSCDDNIRMVLGVREWSDTEWIDWLETALVGAVMNLSAP
jgi:hypothetical protein